MCDVFLNHLQKLPIPRQKGRRSIACTHNASRFAQKRQGSREPSTRLLVRMTESNRILPGEEESCPVPYAGYQSWLGSNKARESVYVSEREAIDSITSITRKPWQGTGILQREVESCPIPCADFWSLLDIKKHVSFVCLSERQRDKKIRLGK